MQKGKMLDEGNGLRSLTHERISAAVSDRLLSLDGCLDTLIEFAIVVWQDEVPIKKEIERLADQVKEHKRPMRASWEGNRRQG